jgi:predicted CxxxxCH...CXXCH cytochrome family protein
MSRLFFHLIVALLGVALYGCDLGTRKAKDAGPASTSLEVACSLPCHGSGANPAPPVDLAGNMDTRATGVGAHRSHLGTSDWRNEITCDACHNVPLTQDSPGHMDSELPAELLTTGFLQDTTWDGKTCSNNYCHGSTLTGGVKTEPLWTVVDGSAGGCGSCHGVPPPEPHPAGTDCGKCHPTMNPGDEFVIAYPALHINGILEVNESAPCETCHGSAENAAPPASVNGLVATT